MTTRFADISEMLTLPGMAKSERKSAGGGDLYWGSWPGMGSLHRFIPEGFCEREEWADQFRAVYVDANKRATVTYCEGDLIIVICPDDESFGKELDHATEFYARH